MANLIYDQRGQAAIGNSYFLRHETNFGRPEIVDGTLTLYAFPMKASLSLESVDSFSRFAEIGVKIDHHDPVQPPFLFFSPTFWHFFPKGIGDLRKVLEQLGIPFNN